MATAREHEQRGERADDKEWTRAENELDKALTDLETSPSANTPLLGEPSYLDHGVIGYTIDEDSRLRTVVLTREGKPEHVLAHRTMANLSPEALKLLVFEATDRTAEGLANAWWIVRNEKWLTADKGSVEWHVDPESRSVLVHLSPNISETDEDALLATAPNYLTIERAEAEIEFLTDRHNDVPPQWGGVQLALHKNGSRHCTSGFTVKGKTTGTRYSLTAGHCVADVGGNGVSFWSGPYFVGSSAGFSNFPTRDAVRLKNSNYSPLIWTDGSDVYNYRTVNGAANPVKDRKLCLSGSRTKSKCNAKVAIANTSINLIGHGIVTQVARLDRTSGSAPICQRGDSGGPVYHRNPDNRRSNVKGIISAGNGVRCYLQIWSAISSHLNVNIVVN